MTSSSALIRVAAEIIREHRYGPLVPQDFIYSSALAPRLSAAAMRSMLEAA